MDLSIEVQVRHSRDPLLIAKDLSQSTYDFGMNSHDLRVLSVICLVIFVLLSVRPIVVLSEIQWVPDWKAGFKSEEGGQDSDEAWWDNPEAAERHERIRQY